MGRLAFPALDIVQMGDEDGRLVVRLLVRHVTHLLLFKSGDFGQRFRTERLAQEPAVSLDADGARRDGLAQFVDGLADVNSGIVGPKSSDVQGDESEIECAADAGAGHQLDAVVVPFDLQVRIAPGLYLGFQVEVVPFGKKLLVDQVLDETRSFRLRSVVVRGRRPVQFRLLQLDLLPGLRLDRVAQDAAPGADLHGRRGHGLSGVINSLAHVDAGIFRNDGSHVQGDVAEIVRYPESRPDFEFDSVDVPLEAEQRIADGHHLALEMGVLSFQQFRRTRQAGGKDELVLIRAALRSFAFFQFADLFHPFRMLALQLDVGLCQDLDGSGRDGLPDSSRMCEMSRAT